MKQKRWFQEYYISFIKKSENMDKIREVEFDFLREPYDFLLGCVFISHFQHLFNLIQIILYSSLFNYLIVISLVVNVDLVMYNYLLLL